MNRLNQIVSAALSSLLLSTAPLLAHEGHEHKVMGTVAAIDAKAGRLEVKEAGGKAVVLMADSKTKVLRGDAPAALKDVVVGSRVVVRFTDEHGMKMASEVRLPEEPKTK